MGCGPCSYLSISFLDSAVLLTFINCANSLTTTVYFPIVLKMLSMTYQYGSILHDYATDVKGNILLNKLLDENYLLDMVKASRTP